MDLIEAITTRKSIRAFKPDPVPKEVLEGLIEVSIRAPSSSNTQPWNFILVGGEAMDRLKRAMVEKFRSGAPNAADFGLPTPSGIYRERRRAFMAQMYGSLGIDRDDEEKKNQWFEAMTWFFGAPNGIFLCLERSLTPWALVDAGLVMQNLLLVAHSYGLATCVIYRAALYPDLVRSLLNIPESKAIVCGIAIGYPDMKAPVNNFRTARDPVHTFVSWHGVD